MMTFTCHNCGEPADLDRARTCGRCGRWLCATCQNRHECAGEITNLGARFAGSFLYVGGLKVAELRRFDGRWWRVDCVPSIPLGDGDEREAAMTALCRLGYLPQDVGGGE
jgi:hypothetical protein